MTLDDVAQKYAETTAAILMCGREKYFESALRLLYSGIDSLSWLYSDQNDLEKRNVRNEYEGWVNIFLLPELKKFGYDCTATEIYYARCSQLHTFSAIAKKQGDNRIVAYASGDGENMNKVNQGLPDIEKMSNGKRFVIIHIGDLVQGFINGTSHFFKLTEEDEELSNKVIEKADFYYAPLDTKVLNKEQNR
ncbi:MAG TPA: hypothetical protein VN426_04730 [Syntrophomonadaceae bacterium]|nr:hypothetical protein [Syntrophomonadaceae bacterium]